ncbi:putative cupredoxin [Lupinus albus]|uniref:Putative cupredoxin n=1 Tax=Lupinus albus TaxID=3870 RepID=A0A6A4N9Z4_LUPAL|nr:putative cupredoxin [Lupinus albus]
MGVLDIIIRVSFVAILIKLGMATNHIVGGPNGGWDTNSDLQTWASSIPFSVGDNLIFQYPPTHNVVEVSKADYESCQPSNPIQSYNDGTTTIPLTSAGKRYFICGTVGHCSQGMKVEIDTLDSATSSASPEPSPFSPEVSTIPSSAPEQTTTPSESPNYIPQVPSPSVETHLESATSSPTIPITEFPAAASPLARDQHSPDLSNSSTMKDVQTVTLENKQIGVVR